MEFWNPKGKSVPNGMVSCVECCREASLDWQVWIGWSNVEAAGDSVLGGLQGKLCLQWAESE